MTEKIMVNKPFHSAFPFLQYTILYLKYEKREEKYLRYLFVV